MAMGRSAGRSSGNRTAEEAIRRNTPRERELIDPPFQREPSSSWPGLLENTDVFTLVAWASCAFIACLLAIVLCAWVGLI